MRFYALLILCVGAFYIGPTSGLQMGSVQLNNNLRYISYGLEPSPNRSHILCPYTLEPGEEVLKVFWEMWDGEQKVGEYEWRPDIRGQVATGRLAGVVRLDRSDGGLELTSLRYDLGGFYSCGVTLTSRQTEVTKKEEVLVIDLQGPSIQKNGEKACLFTSSFRSPAVYPEPTVRAGMFLPSSRRFHKEVPENKWRIFSHFNGSYTYTFDNVTFEIDENFPDEALFTIMLGITKTNGTYISLSSFTTNNPSWHEHGCEEVLEEGNKEVHYFPGFTTPCRGGRRANTKATMTCKKGYTSASNDVNIIVMRCEAATLTWQPEGHTTNTFQDLQCVPEADGNTGAQTVGNPHLVLLFTPLLYYILLHLLRPY